MYWESVKFRGRSIYIKHRMYYDIAMENLGKSILEEKKYNAGKGIGESAVAAMKTQRYLCISTVFMYLTVESFINYYAVVNEIPDRKSFEKISTENKWKIYPRLTTGKGVNGKAIKDLKKLTNKRNVLIHYKSSIEIDIQEDPTNLSIKECFEYNDIVINLFNALKNIDQKVDIKWLYKSRDYFLNEEVT